MVKSSATARPERKIATPPKTSPTSKPSPAGTSRGALTEREFRVAELLPLPNREIAQKLGITESTVKVHLRSAMKKLGCKNRAELALAFQKPVEEVWSAAPIAHEIRTISVEIPDTGLHVEVRLELPIVGRVVILIN